VTSKIKSPRATFNFVGRKAEGRKRN